MQIGSGAIKKSTILLRYIAAAACVFCITAQISPVVADFVTAQAAPKKPIKSGKKKALKKKETREQVLGPVSGAKTGASANSKKIEPKLNDGRTAVQVSRAKRRAAREAQRQAGIPTSRTGIQVQWKKKQPRHQIKDGADGKKHAVVDGRKDRAHGPHVEAGRLKTGTSNSINSSGMPRIYGGKSKGKDPKDTHVKPGKAKKDY